MVVAIDPNDKEGPEGEGPDGAINPTEAIGCAIRFTNLPGATAAARQVVITDQLAPNLNWQTFQVKETSIGGRAISLDRRPSGGASRPNNTLGVNSVFKSVVPTSAHRVEPNTFLSWKKARRPLVFDLYLWQGDVRPAEPTAHCQDRASEHGKP